MPSTRTRPEPRRSRPVRARRAGGPGAVLVLIAAGLLNAGATKQQPRERDVTERTFRTYAEAAKEAARIDIEDGLFAKVQVSRYGSGYVVRKLPVEFLLDPELKRRFVRPVEYSQL